MNLIINDRVVEIQLSPLECLWAFHLSGKIEVPLETIQSVRLEQPHSSWWKELKAPGTHLPGIFKAGTYYTERGREFWYVQGDQPCLCLDTTAGYYKRIVIASAEVADWTALIGQAKQDALQRLA